MPESNDLDEVELPDGDLLAPLPFGSIKSHGVTIAIGLWAALLKAQGEFPVIGRGKTAEVPTKSGKEYSYDYADLGDIMRAVGPVLRANGLVLTQPVQQTDYGTVIATTIVHVPSGEREVSEFPLPMEGMPAQSVGSLITYFKRYAVQAALGIVTESDSDAADVDVPRRQTGQAPRAGTRAPQGARGGSGAASGPRPSVGVLFDDLQNTASTIATDGGRAEWEDFKAESGWDRIWANSPEVRESKRDLIERGLQCVRSIRAGEKARAGEEPWDPLQGAGAVIDGSEGQPEPSTGYVPDDEGNPNG